MKGRPVAEKVRVERLIGRIDAIWDSLEALEGNLIGREKKAITAILATLDALEDSLLLRAKRFLNG